MNGSLKTDLLVFAIGNTARGDDAAGWELGQRIELAQWPGVQVEYRYQLQVEDAELAASFPAVIFIDATEEHLPNGCGIRKCHADGNVPFTTHEQNPQGILYLVRELYGRDPQTWILAVSGYQWELGAPLCSKARMNMEKAWQHLEKWIPEKQFPMAEPDKAEFGPSSVLT